MKKDRGHEDAASTGATESTSAAPGKRAMTEGLPTPVQRASLPSAPAPLSMDGPDLGAYADPFGVHLETPVQRQGDGGGGGDVHAAAARGIQAPAERLPFLDQIQRSFGPDHDVSGVNAHVGGAAAEASSAMGASAYATGNHVAFGKSPDLHTAAHEAAHVVQQAHGVSLYGGVGTTGDSYEQNADAVADRVVSGASAADLLPTSGGAASGVQKKENSAAPKEEASWITRARDYHREHPTFVAQFKAATNNACVGADGELDPNEIARWQVAHGLKPDGICGPDTAHAAASKDTPAPQVVSPNAPVPVVTDAPLPAPHDPWAADPTPNAGPSGGPTSEQTLKAIKSIGSNVADAAGNLFDTVIDAFTGGGDAAKTAGGGTTPTPTPAPSTPSTTPSQGPTEPEAPPPKHAPIAQGDLSDLSDATLRDIAAASSDPKVKEIAADLAGLAATSDKLRHSKKMAGAEEAGKERDDFVANIGVVRGKLASLKGEAQFKGAAYKLIASIGTYYSQSRNIDILETPPADQTRTCNITSLSMALEGLGIDAPKYGGGHEKVQAAARMYQHKISGDDKSKAAADAVGGRGVSWGALTGMRLPDFMELAAIARSMPDTSDDGVKAGAKSAWDSILSIYTLKELAGKFGSSGSVKAFDATGAKRVKANKKKGIAKVDSDVDVLGDFGSDHRKAVEKYINAKNKGQVTDELQAGYDAAMADNSIEDRLSLETYRDYVIETIGADLAAGGSIVIALTGHYAKLQAIVADGVIVNDPARDSRAATHLTFAEARAMGYFKHRLVLT